LHLLQMVELVRMVGRIWPHSMQSIVANFGQVVNFFVNVQAVVGKKLPEVG
jgi:hypothetical protein